MEERWSWHCYDALRSRDRFVFHAAIRKHGIDAWQHEVLEAYDDQESAKSAEIRLIVEHRTFFYENPNVGYNMTKGGDGSSGVTWSDERRARCSGVNAPMYGRRGPLAPAWGKPGTMLGRQHTQETKNLMSRSHTGRNITWGQKISEAQPSCVRVVQLQLNGDHVTTHHSLGAAERATGISRSNIWKCCKGRIKTSGGFRWIYETS